MGEAVSPVSFDLRLLEPFVVLVDHGLRFGCAARQLGVGQPGLSRQVARLQRQLRAALVVRDGRHHLLTAAGARFLDHARAVLQRADALTAELHAASGTVRIHVGTGAHRGARELVASFLAAHPSTPVEIVEGLSGEARHALLRQAVDVAFDLRTTCPPGMRFTTVERSPLGVLTSAEHPLARRGSATWDDLAGQPVLFGPVEGGSWNTLVRAALADAGVTVTEKIGPHLPKLPYLVPLIAGGSTCFVTGHALFAPLPPGLAWTALTPHRHLEYGVIWDPRRSAAPVERFLAFARHHAPGAPVGPPDDAGDGRADEAVRRSRFDLRLVLPFVAVAQERHFGRAAATLAVAQPALSRQVARLESQLGVTLLARSTRTTELTAAGHLALAAGRDILDHARRAQLSAVPTCGDAVPT